MKESNKLEYYQNRCLYNNGLIYLSTDQYGIIHDTLSFLECLNHQFFIIIMILIKLY